MRTIFSLDGNSIIPAPYVQIQDVPIIAPNQTRIGTTYNLTIQGKLITYTGSPASTGGSPPSWGGYGSQFWQDTQNGYPPNETNPSNALHQLYMMESKQAALQSLFSQDGKTLTIQTPDGSPALTCTTKNAEVNFEAGNWFTECSYTITLQTDALVLNGQVQQNLPATGFIQSSSESWQFNPGDIVKTFNVTHTVSAQGKETFAQPPWMNARDYVNTQLVLGWSGTSPYSNIPGGSIFNQSSLNSGVLNLQTYAPYNFSRTENVDEMQGTYEVTESWLLSQQASGVHIYTVSTKRIAEDPYTNVIASIQGNIHGFYVNLFDYDSRLANATYFWSQLAAPTGLLNLVQQYTNTPYSLPTTTGYNPFNLQPRAGSIDYNYQDGSISYQYDFDNTLYHVDAFDEYVISRKTSADNYLTSFGIAGTVKGRRYDGDTNVLAGFNRAYIYWAGLSGSNYNTLYQRVLTNVYFPEASGIGIQPAPINVTVDMNQAEGTIQYSFEFNNRVTDFGSGVWANKVTDEYQVSKHFSVDEGITTYSLQGTVQGLNIVDTNPRFAKYANATGYFYLFVQPNLYSRVTGVYPGISLPNPNPLVQEITLFPVQGVVQYQFDFRNTFPPLLSGVLSEHITISEVNYSEQVNVIGRIPIIGRSGGDIIQDMSTTILKQRMVNVEAVVNPTGGPNLLASFLTKPNYDAAILTLKPTNGYCQQFDDSYDFKNGHYSMTVAWVYQ